MNGSCVTRSGMNKVDIVGPARHERVGNLRIIPRLDIKGPNLIKGVRLEGLRVMGDPQEFALRYYNEGADELLYMDIVASLYGRNNLSDIISRAADRVFIPITVGGGIRSVDDAKLLLRSGADKVAVNTAAIARPDLISELAQRFGSQATVVSIEAKRVAGGDWEAFTDNGRERTGRSVRDWVRQAVERGAGEILLTSVDQEGTGKGFDLDLIRTVAALVPIPVIASGGMRTTDDFRAAAAARADAIAMADALHRGKLSLSDIRNAARDAGLPVRRSN
jgi:cyclase